jgi:hypothetical protein
MHPEELIAGTRVPACEFAASPAHDKAARDTLQTALRTPSAMPASVDVTLVVTFHREGLLASWTLQGLQLARQHAEEQGLGVQIVALLDRPDADTLEIVRQHAVWRAPDWLLQVDAGDPGTTRNVGVLFAQGQTIGVIDGDDFCSPSWIVRAHALAQQYGASVVVHPEYIISFGVQYVQHRLIDQRYDAFPLSACVTVNPWSIMSAAHALIFKTTPYQSTRARDTGFGFEDWHWNLEVLSKGVLHVCAPQTAHYYRRRAGSVLQQETAQATLSRPSRFFEDPQKWSTGFALCEAYRPYARQLPELATTPTPTRKERAWR